MLMIISKHLFYLYTYELTYKGSKVHVLYASLHASFNILCPEYGTVTGV